jgi:Predicted membrane protein
MYLGVSIPLMVLSVLLFTLTTPYKEFHIMALGDDLENPRHVAAAKAVAFDIGGKVLGLAILLASAIYHAVDLWDMSVWTLTGTVTLIIVYWLFELITPTIKVRREIPNGNIAVGIFSFCLSIATGILMAALISY